MMAVFAFSVQMIEGLGYYSRTITATGNIEDASRQY